MQDVSDHGDAAEVFPITHRPQFELLSEVGQMTSACSLTFELSGAWPERFAASAFVAEPVHNLVHRDRYAPAGSTFVAHRAFESGEFLASSDPWFRPVNLYFGPDAALFVIDYYRPLIEHPEWTASDRHTDSPALYVGQDRGRIYRVTPEEGKLDEWPRPGRLRNASDAELVALLGHRNAWWRRTAQRLLLDRKSNASVPLLDRAVRERPSAFARLHALWTLEGLERLTPETVTVALTDAEPGVRENAVRLAEPYLASPSSRPAPLLNALLAMLEDADPRVRFQLLATLGDIDTPEANRAHERLLLAHLDDEWMQVAGLSAASDRMAPMLSRLLGEQGPAARPGATPPAASGPQPAGRLQLVERLASMVGARGRASEIDAIVRAPAGSPAGADWWRAPVLKGLAEGLARTREGREAARVRQAEILRFVEAGTPEVRRAALEVLAAAGFVSEPPTRAVIARAARTARSNRADATSGQTPWRCSSSRDRRRTRRFCASWSRHESRSRFRRQRSRRWDSCRDRAWATSCWSAGRR